MMPEPTLTPTQLALLRRIERRAETDCPVTLAEMPSGDGDLERMTWVLEFVSWNKGWVVILTPAGRRALADHTCMCGATKEPGETHCSRRCKCLKHMDPPEEADDYERNEEEKEPRALADAEEVA